MNRPDAGQLPESSLPADQSSMFSPGNADDHVFRSLVEDSPDIIARFDRQMRFLYINNAITVSTHRPRTYFLGKSLSELGIDSQLIPPVSPIFERAFTTGYKETVEYTYSTPHGTLVFHTLVIPERNSSGSVETILALARDITELKQAEKALQESESRLNAILQSTRAIIYLLDRDDRLLHANRRFEELYGSSTEQVVGKAFRELTSPEVAEKIVSVSHQVFENKVAREFEEVIPLADGEHIFSSIYSPLLDEAGNVYAVVCLSYDTTERKRAEDALTEYAQKLERSNQELEQFAFTASHDLQEPLRKVRAFSEQIQVKYGAAIGEEGREFIHRMNVAVRRMEEMISSLLAYSRVTTKPQPFTRVDLNAIVQSVLVDLDVRIEQTKGRVEVGDLPVVMADPMQMRQLMQNLIGNALKFHQPKIAPVVRISSQTVALRGRDWIEIRVEDNGVGFDEKYTHLVFQPFQRLHGRSEYEGSGMGLAICRKIIERHGGEISVRSIVNAGTTFTILFPIEMMIR